MRNFFGNSTPSTAVPIPSFRGEKKPHSDEHERAVEQMRVNVKALFSDADVCRRLIEHGWLSYHEIEYGKTGTRLPLAKYKRISDAFELSLAELASPDFAKKKDQ